MSELPASIAAWPPDWRDAYEERAAIMEFDGRMPRLKAERLAEQHCRERFRQGHATPEPVRLRREAETVAGAAARRALG